MTRKITLEQAPWHARTGDLLAHVDSYRANDPEYVRWRPNGPFEATLVLHSIRRGHSAAHYLWRDAENDRTMQMFLADAFDLMSSALGVRNGRVTAAWVIQKRGANYGVRLYARQLPKKES